MSRHIRQLSFVLALGLAAPLAAQERLPADSLGLGRQWSGWFLTGQVDSLVARTLPRVVVKVGGLDGYLRMRQMVAENAGGEKRLIEERFVWRHGERQYWRTMEMTDLPEPFLLRFVVLEDGRIGGIGLGPLSAAPAIDSAGPVIRSGH